MSNAALSVPTSEVKSFTTPTPDTTIPDRFGNVAVSITSKVPRADDSLPYVSLPGQLKRMPPGTVASGQLQASSMTDCRELSAMDASPMMRPGNTC